MVTAVALPSVGSHAPGGLSTPPSALTPVTSATFQNILQALPFVPDETSGVAEHGSLNSNLLATKKGADRAANSIGRTAGSKIPEVQAPAWMPNVPTAPAPTLSTIKQPAAKGSAFSLDSTSEQLQSTFAPRVFEAASLPSPHAGLVSVPDANQAVHQVTPETELAVNISRPLGEASPRSSANQGPSVTQLLARPVAQPIAPPEHFAAPAPETPLPSDPANPRSQLSASPALDLPASSNEVGALQDRTAPERRARQAGGSSDLIHNAVTTALAPAQAPSEQPARNNTQPAGQLENGSLSGSLVQAEIASVINNRAQAISLAPRSENEAFSLKLVQNDSPQHAPVRPQSVTPTAQSTPAARTEATSSTNGDARSTALPAANDTHQPIIAKAAGQATAQTTNPAWHESSALANVVPHAEIQLAEQTTPLRTNSATTAAHEVAVLPHEAPRPSVSNEILLQLGGKDQPATIRVVDRAGTVNVSVHAADPDLRASLRSNLGDLASQLSHQGWKTEVVKTQTVLMQSNSSRDSSPDSQRGPGQQHSSAQGERQPQRDRRGNGGQWLAQFEESLTQNSSNSGGMN